MPRSPLVEQVQIHAGHACSATSLHALQLHWSIAKSACWAVVAACCWAVANADAACCS